ncbi:NADPH-dependent FMN reductase [Oryzicola mucosus]|uniref:NAD(P)H-dependent oxidoreductase n=1 Tax=Oryzicola mucosus TaxID=2767425 RepID=A0A8J6TZX8_9HYPH|nr:NAD(P)H-dependent oxidoreductase [Oryzicola mucosus]
MSSHKLNVVISSTRPGRVGPVFAKWFADFAKTHGTFDVDLVDLADFDLPVFNEPKHPRLGQYEHEATKKWSASVASGDAFVFVTPEYNYFPPSSLINALTYLSAEWRYKPVGFVSYGGVSGGLRAVQPVKELVTTLSMMPIPAGVPIPGAHSHIKDGVFASNDLIDDAAKTMLGELHKWSVALQPMRA